MFCTRCGAQVNSDMAFCGSCGSTQPQNKNRIYSGVPGAKTNGSPKRWLKWVIISTIVLVVGLTGLIVWNNLSNDKEYDIERINSLEYHQELKFDDSRAMSISPNGKYILAFVRDEFHVYENKAHSYVFKNSIPVDAELGVVDDTAIAWSNSGEMFAFCIPRALLKYVNSDIYICDINKRSVVNLTGISGEDSARLSAGDTLFIDYMPAFSGDDKTIFFARWGSERGNRANGLCSVDIDGGNLKTVKNLPDDYSIYQGLYSRGNAVFYNLTANYRDAAQGICKYEDGNEAILAKRQGVTPYLLDVSNDGEIMLYSLPDHSSMPDEARVDNKFFFCNTDEYAEAIELLPVSDGGQIVNVFFAPAGHTILRIEFASGTTSMYVQDLDKSDIPPKLVYQTDNSSSALGSTSSPVNYTLLQPKWLTNGFVAMNGDVSFLLKVNTD